jgi:hypothetical protein
MKKLALFILMACIAAFAQVPVTLSPQPVFTSYLQNGQPNAFGCVLTFANNTTNPQVTYTDYSGTTENPYIVPLTAGGTANIWLAENEIYTIVIKTYGGVNCQYGQTVSSTNGVTGYYGLLNLPNTWYATQTFAEPIVISPLSFQIVTGTAPNQTTLNFPQPSGNVTLTFPSTTQNILGNLSPQITTPIVNGCGMTNGPGTYVCIANNSSTATVLNGLATLTGAPSTATVSPITATGGVIGIVTAGAGITGNATIQQSGTVSCIFDGATTAGDYVEISTTTAGDCHDSGLAPPTPLPQGTQEVGIVLSTNSGAGTYTIALASGGSGGGNAIIVSASGVATTTSANTTSAQQLKQIIFPANTQNAVSKTFRITAQITVVPGGGSSNQQVGFCFGNSSGMCGTGGYVVSTSSNSSDFSVAMTFTCVVATASGGSGTFTCNPQVDTSTGTPIYTAISGSSTWTSPLYFAPYCSFSVASTSNTCTQNVSVGEQLN